MKHLLFRLALLAPLGLLLVVINRKIDPANLFSSSAHERQMAEVLVTGQRVTSPRNFNERLLERFFVSKLPQRRPVLVIGSSRSMLVGDNVFPAGSVVNVAMSGAVTEDLLAAYDLYLSRGWKPDTIVIGLDAWMLNDNHGQERWRPLTAEVAHMKQTLGLTNEEESNSLLAPGSELDKMTELVSLNYFQNSMKILMRRLTERYTKPEAPVPGVPAKSQPIKREVSDEVVRNPDGTITYDRKFQEQDAEVAARAYISAKPVYSLGQFTELSATNKRALEQMAAHAQQQGTKVVFFLAPYHPIVWQFLRTTPEYANAVKAEGWFRELAAQRGIRVLGAYDPAVSGLTGNDFYDGMHCKPEAIVRLFRGHGAGTTGDSTAAISAGGVH